MITQQAQEKELSRSQILIFGMLAIILGVLLGNVVGLSPNIIVPILAVFGLVVVILSVTNLEFGLLVFIALTYMRVSDVGVHRYNAPSIAQPFFFLLLVAIVLRWALSGDFPRGWLTPAVLVLAYGFVILGSMFYALDFATAQVAAADFWKDGLIAILLAALIQTKSTFRRVIWVLILSGIFLGTLSVIQYMTGTYSNDYFGFALAPIKQIVGATKGYRVTGPIGEPNFYAQIMLVLVPLAINRLIYEKSIILKFLAGYGVLVISLTVILTFSRGGFFALLVALLVLMFYHPPRLPLLMVLVALVAIIVLYLPNNFLIRMGTITGIVSGQETISSDASIIRRASGMSIAWLMFLDHPVIGVGVNNYPVYYQQYSRQLGLDQVSTGRRSSDSLFLEIAAETGVLGILTFGSVLYYFFRCVNIARMRLAKKVDNNFRDLVGAFSAGMIGYLAAALFLHAAYPRYFWLLVGIASALPNIIKDETNQEKQDLLEP